MSKKVLIVEDDEKIAMSLSIRLKNQGYEVLTAGDATYGVSRAVSEQPDLILLDVMMPAGGGVWMAERLRGLEDTRGIPVVFLTASRQPGLREKAMSLGAAAYFEKPYEAQELLGEIGRILGPVGAG